MPEFSFYPLVDGILLFCLVFDYCMLLNLASEQYSTCLSVQMCNLYLGMAFLYCQGYIRSTIANGANFQSDYNYFPNRRLGVSGVICFHQHDAIKSFKS